MGAHLHNLKGAKHVYLHEPGPDPLTASGAASLKCCCACRLSAVSCLAGAGPGDDLEVLLPLKTQPVPYSQHPSKPGKAHQQHQQQQQRQQQQQTQAQQFGEPQAQRLVHHTLGNQEHSESQNQQSSPVPSIAQATTCPPPHLSATEVKALRGCLASAGMPSPRAHVYSTAALGVQRSTLAAAHSSMQVMGTGVPLQCISVVLCNTCMQISQYLLEAGVGLANSTDHLRIKQAVQKP
eukprot:scaffold53496_cov18-Tisochrysis_lutea.AAC.4